MLGMALQPRGYSERASRFEPGEAIEFVAPLFTGYEKSLNVMFNDVSAGPGLGRLIVDFQVTSTRQAEIRILLGLSSEIEEFELLDTRIEPTIIGVSALGLLGMWGDEQQRGARLPSKWAMPDSEARSVAQEIVDFAADLGERFYEHVGSPGALAEALLELESMPGVLPNKGAPGSDSRWEYAAVLYRDLGLPDEAMASFDKGFEHVRSRVSAGLVHEDSLRLLEEMRSAYLPWIRSN